MRIKSCKPYFNKKSGRWEKLKHDWVLIRGNQVCTHCGHRIKATKKFYAELNKFKKMSKKFKNRRK